ncbi:MAG TPA: inositol monophosphatase family protein [Kineosporiaceae bacterium]
MHGTDVPPSRPVAAGAPAALRITVSRSRPPAVATALALDLGGELVPLGSAGAKAAAVWRGDVDAYVHAGGLHEWDAAAPVAVALAAGLHVSRLDGEPVAFNQVDPYLDDLLICTPELAGPILAWTARHARDVSR